MKDKIKDEALGKDWDCFKEINKDLADVIEKRVDIAIQKTAEANIKFLKDNGYSLASRFLKKKWLDKDTE